MNRFKSLLCKTRNFTNKQKSLLNSNKPSQFEYNISTPNFLEREQHWSIFPSSFELFGTMRNIYYVFLVGAFFWKIWFILTHLYLFSLHSFVWDILYHQSLLLYFLSACLLFNISFHILHSIYLNILSLVFLRYWLANILYITS